MSDQRGDPDGGGPEGGHEGGHEVGTVADEAARLFAAINERIREHRPPAGAAGAAGPRAGEHSGQDRPRTCQWCPLCQALDFLRDTSPEVRAQVVSSAGALVLALRELLDQAGRAPATRAADEESRGRRNGVEHIDLGSDEGAAEGTDEGGSWG